MVCNHQKFIPKIAFFVIISLIGIYSVSDSFSLSYPNEMDYSGAQFGYEVWWKGTNEEEFQEGMEHTGFSG